MSASIASPMLEVERLRNQTYNASVLKIRLVNEDLMVLRVRPDEGIPAFLPGQFTVLGLGAWEPPVSAVRDTLCAQDPPRNLIKRLYSISCPLLGDDGQIVRTSEIPYFEFYISQVHPADSQSLTLTPRLFALKEGDRIFCSREARGNYTLQRLPGSANAIFVATGTGEAPHNAMVSELLATRFPGRIVSVTCVRRKADLGYVPTHRELERRFPNYRYLTLTTRESENIDPTQANFVAKRYLQDYFQSGDFERDAGVKLSAEDSHVFLCGNPKMIGRSERAAPRSSQVVQPIGVIEILERRDFRLDRPNSPGNIHVEKYW